MTQHIPLTEWDKKLGPRLQDLEYCGSRIAFYARHIQALISTLPIRPSWESLARCELNNAERELRVALAIVKAAQKLYDDAPVVTESFKTAAE